MEINELFLKDEDLHRLCRNQKFLNMFQAMQCIVNWTVQNCQILLSSVLYCTDSTYRTSELSNTTLNWKKLLNITMQGAAL